MCVITSFKIRQRQTGIKVRQMEIKQRMNTQECGDTK